MNNMAYVIQLKSTSAFGAKTKNGKATMSAEALKAHVDRVGNYANQANIDPSRTADNYSLDDWDDDLDYHERAERLRETAGINKKRDFRKDASFIASFVISASPEEMSTLTPDQQKAYFETAKDFLDDYFGDDMLLYADVHNDEETPHMHIGYVPINDDTRNLRWDAKIKRGTMSQVFQKDLPNALKDAGFDFEMPKERAVKDIEEHRVDTKSFRKIIEMTEEETKAAAREKIDNEYVPEYKAKREKEVEQEISDNFAENKAKIAQQQQQQAELATEIEQMTQRKQEAYNDREKALDEEAKAMLAKTDAELAQKQAEDAQRLAEAQTAEIQAKGEELSERLKTLNKKVVRAEKVEAASKTLRDVLVDAGVDKKVAGKLAIGSPIRSKASPNRTEEVDARNVLRGYIAKMSDEEKVKFQKKQYSEISKNEDRKKSTKSFDDDLEL